MTASPPAFLTSEEDPLDELARRHLLDFTERTHHDYRPAEFHIVMCETLERFAAGEIERLAIMAPPRRGKTEHVSRRLPAWMLGRNPDASLIAGSYGALLAEKNSRDVQRIITSEEYRRIFPGTQLNSKNVVSDARHETKRTAEEWEIVGRRGVYKCGGVGGSFTGLGAGWALIDDPHKNREEAYSQRHRDRAWNWMITDIESRLEPPGCLLLMMTSWHSDDVIRRYLKTEGRVEDGGIWHVLEFPEYEDFVDKERRSYDTRALGEYLWLGRFLKPNEDEDEVGRVELIRRATAERAKRLLKSEDVDASLYQQRPKAAGGNTFKDAWMTHRYQVLPMEGEFFVTVDPKGGGKDPKSSRFVMQLWNKDQPARINLIDQFRGLWSQAECLAVMRTVFKGDPPTPPPGSSVEFGATLRAIATRKSLPIWRKASIKLIEPKADGMAIIDTLCLEIPRLEPYKMPKGSKQVRWDASTGYWAAGNVWLPDETVIPWAAEWIAEFLAEMTNVPSYGTDDQADSATMAVDYGLGAGDDTDPWAQDNGEDVWAGY